ncbi:hypothetical protein N431DRAFT_383133 [Stipitochalara longipes BDJ]|nr:hypothetical protein N431DRAFT_383133 [Stipitochalara longipes BDJ]
MSLPPATIKIKRKHTDEPVDYLQIHHGDGKRQKVPAGYIFSRQPTDDVATASSLIPQPVRRIKQLHRSTSSQALGTTTPSSSQENIPPVTPLSKDVSQTATPPSTPFHQNDTPRRFHMSRSGTPIGNTPTVVGKKRKDAAVFIERKRPRSSEGKQETPQPDEAVQKDAAKQAAPLQDQEKPGPGFVASQIEEKPRKKPGLAARSSTPPVRSTSPSKPLAAPIQNVRLPSGMMMPWDVGSDRLAAEMQAYTLEEIGRTMARQEAESAAEASRIAALREKSASSPLHKNSSNFKPKKPALRYAERHPEEQTGNRQEAMEVDEPHIGDEDEDMDDGEYIIDTYVRIPADALEREEQSKNFGLLVLDTQPDIDEFYREEEDSEEEDDDEEEDENAENHYTADYPDEEVASDDEFDRNAYNYRTGNASDLEEYDELDDDDVALSDDEAESTKYPWKAKPWLKRAGEKSILDEDGEE